MLTFDNLIKLCTDFYMEEEVERARLLNVDIQSDAKQTFWQTQRIGEECCTPHFVFHAKDFA